MSDNPLGAIEFVLFIGFAIWLFLRQNNSRPTRSESDEDASGPKSQPSAQKPAAGVDRSARDDAGA